MDHWHAPYLGLSTIPSELNEFELNTFFTFSPSERRVIDGRRQPLYRLAVALHIGFIRMTGCTLDAYKQIPYVLWAHLGKHIGVTPPEIGTLRSLYDDNPRMLFDHQKVGYEALRFETMSEHRRRYLVRWLKELMMGRPDTSTLLMQVKTWLYQHRILIVHDRELKRLIQSAIQAHEGKLEQALSIQLGDATISHWATQLSKPDDEHGSLQEWMWAVPLRHSTGQMRELFQKIDRLYGLKVATAWPDEVNEALVRHYARRCANRPPSVSKRVRPLARKLETSCFMRYALCSTTDQLLSMFRRWLREITNDAKRQVDAVRPDMQKMLYDFVASIEACAADESLDLPSLREKLAELIADIRNRKPPSRASLIRLQLLTKGAQARAMLSKLVELPFQSEV